MDPTLIPNVSIDCVVFGFDMHDLKVLLVERDVEYNNQLYHDLKLPGDLVQKNEELDSAACRILHDLSGLQNLYLNQFASFGGVNRLMSKERDLLWLKQIDHPEERVITIAYYSLINLTSAKEEYILRANARWVSLEELGDLAFDHAEIISKAYSMMKQTFKVSPIAFELLPDKFTLSQLQKIYEVVLKTQYDKRNFRKKISQISCIVPINEKQTNVAHKPARLYMFSKDIYEKTRKDNFDFTV